MAMTIHPIRIRGAGSFWGNQLPENWKQRGTMTGSGRICRQGRDINLSMIKHRTGNSSCMVQVNLIMLMFSERSAGARHSRTDFQNQILARIPRQRGQ